MALNCRPGQRAWISVPARPQEIALGLFNLNGYVVQTVHLMPEAPASQPTWVVDPPQIAVTTTPMLTQYGFLPAGTPMQVRGIPDEYLRPFTDFPPEEIEERQLEAST